MKKLLLSIVSLLPFALYAQSAQDSVQPSSYMFKDFIEGNVLMTTGAKEQALLNYDANNQSIIFKKGGQNMILTGLETIDTVYLLDKKFVPIDHVFYEVGTTTPVALLIMYSCKPHPLVAATDHNGTSRQSGSHVNNAVSEVYLNRRFQGQYSMEFRKNYWLRRGHSLYKANNEKQVAKVFPRREEAIREFVEKNRISFDDPKDVIQLIKFCNGQL